MLQNPFIAQIPSQPQVLPPIVTNPFLSSASPSFEATYPAIFNAIAAELKKTESVFNRSDSSSSHSSQSSFTYVPSWTAYLPPPKPANVPVKFTEPPPNLVKCPPQQQPTASPQNFMEAFVTDILKIPDSRLKAVENIALPPVKLINIRSPSRFSIQFNLKVLQNIMEEMSQTYSTNLKEHLRVKNIKPGMSVAVQFNSKWYRGEVQMLLQLAKVSVKLIDYDETIFVSTSCLRYLKKSFCSASKCCTLASLANVKPTNHEEVWNIEAVESFNKFTKDCDLFAKIEGEKDGRVTVNLYLDNKGRLSIVNKMILNNFCRLDDKSNEISGKKPLRFVLE